MLADIVAQKESPYFYQNQKQTNKNWEARNNPHNLLVSTCQLCWFSPYTCLSTLVPLTVFPLPPANSVLLTPSPLSSGSALICPDQHPTTVGPNPALWSPAPGWVCIFHGLSIEDQPSVPVSTSCPTAVPSPWREPCSHNSLPQPGYNSPQL